jgi:hypothetical protein
MIHKTEWLDILNIIDKDDKYIFITETYQPRQRVVVRAPKKLFGIIRNRRPNVKDRVRFHLDDDNRLVGFEVYRY